MLMRWALVGIVRVSKSPLFFFFFQAEDGIRDLTVTGFQTCALPISSASPAPAPAAAPSPSPSPKLIKPSLRSVLVMLVVALAGVLLVLRAWNLFPFAGTVVSTDNAYVRGAVTVLAPQVSGYVTEVLVQDYENVKAGQPLVRIDARTYEAAQAQAQAQLANARAQLANADQTQAQNRATLGASRAGLAAAQAESDRAAAELQRVQALSERGSVSLNERDKVRATARLAATNVAKAQADIEINAQKIKATTVNRASLEAQVQMAEAQLRQDRKSTRLNSSHSQISYAVFCLKKKKKNKINR